MDDIWLEVGAGSFEHAQTIATQNPAIGLIACEVFENGIASLLSRLAPVGEEESLLKNLRVYAGDARALIRELPDRSIGRAFLMFPDPWPKARHTKRRFVHPMILHEMARIMRGGGANGGSQAMILLTRVGSTKFFLSSRNFRFDCGPW